MKNEKLCYPVIIVLLTHATVIGQLTDLDYWDVRRFKIESITEWKIYHDSAGTETARYPQYEFTYDDKGNLIEKKYGFSLDSSKWVTTTYRYNKYHEITDEKTVDPYPSVLSARPYTPRLLAKCETYNTYDNPSHTLLSFADESTETWIFEYMPGYNYPQLPMAKKVYQNGLLKNTYTVTYKFRK